MMMLHAFFGVLQPAVMTRDLELEATAVTRRLDYSSAYGGGRRFLGRILVIPSHVDLATLPVKVCRPGASACCVACRLVRETQWVTKVHTPNLVVSGSTARRVAPLVYARSQANIDLRGYQAWQHLPGHPSCFQARFLRLACISSAALYGFRKR